MTEPSGDRIPGVEELLPPGERVLWHGAPTRAGLARHAFHARKIVVYFAALFAIAALLALGDPAPARAMVVGAVSLGVSAGAATAFALLLATLTARTTVYAITDRRIVMKIGVALPVVLNVPLRLVDSAAVAHRRDGTGDVAIHLAGDVRVAWLVLWPHARAWRLRHPEPLLRALGDVDAVSIVLRDALLAQATSASAAAPAAAEPRAEAAA